MDNFAAVVSSLLARIRALHTSRPGNPRPPSAAAVDYSSLYRVAPTAWGLDPSGGAPDGELPAATSTAAPTPTAPAPKPRRRLETAVFGLPVPRGLPVT